MNIQYFMTKAFVIDFFIKIYCQLP